MKKILSFMLAATLILSLAACGESGDTLASGDTDVSDSIETATPSNGDSDSNPEITIPNNGEWDEILCSGDDYHLVKKEIDSYDGYKFMIGVVNSKGEWVQEMSDTGAFVEGVQFRAMGSSEILRDSSCYTYLGEGVFLASPGVSVYSKDTEQRIGPWENTVSYSPTGRAEVSIWECLIWNVVDNSQKEFDASKISVFQDGYLLFCQEEELGSGTLNSMNSKGEITELSCRYLPNKPMHNFPVYAEGLFFANSENSKPGFFDIEGNMVIDLSEYEVSRIPYSSEMGVNAPYFENGQATILIANNADSVFRAVIDKTGALIGEPEKIDVPVL